MTSAAVAAFLEQWLGRWPPRGRLDVVGHPLRAEPGWDGRPHPVIGVESADGATVLSVPPEVEAQAGRLAGGPRDDHFGEGLARLAARPGAVLGRGVLRWSERPASLEPVASARWVPPDDPAVPDWLRPFNGDVLLAFDEEGRYLAGVGRKQHVACGHELSVGTAEHARGRGLARRLVVMAARRVLDDGAVPLYLHDPRNGPSARVADAAGFADRGWGVWALFGGSDGARPSPAPDITAPP